MKRSRITIGAVVLVAATAATVTGIARSTATPPTAKARQEFMQHLQQLSKAGLLSSPARVAIAKMTGGQSQSSPPERDSEGASARVAGIHVAGPGLANVRVTTHPKTRISSIRRLRARRQSESRARTSWATTTRKPRFPRS